MSQLALDRLRQQFGAAVIATHDFRGDETAVVDRARIVEICAWLRDDPELRFNMLADMTAVDYLVCRPVPTMGPQATGRFEVIYQLYSVPGGKRLRLKVQLPAEAPEVDTISALWACANWLEREIWDMYGIRFMGHPELRRILLYEEFVGHPLRKDYPNRFYKAKPGQMKKLCNII